ncbi:hypothetical protein ACFFF7_09715 [Novosphingobium aquiterrae]|uniref:Uncharacterized protein n=1 Tax=Novosphingobium aquiterrae TaxID=624388 RepID=A0ABV6PJE6_9SPHN
MSRYSLKPLPEHSDIFEVAVGWDPGLGTFFVMVFGVPDAARDPIVRYWYGGQPNHLVTVEELQNVAAPYAEIPAELARQLANDQRDSEVYVSRRLSRFISQLLNR